MATEIELAIKQFEHACMYLGSDGRKAARTRLDAAVDSLQKAPDDYKPGQWWTEALKALWAAPIGSEVTAEHKRAAKVALDFLAASPPPQEPAPAPEPAKDAYYTHGEKTYTKEQVEMFTERTNFLRAISIFEIGINSKNHKVARQSHGGLKLIYDMMAHRISRLEAEKIAPTEKHDNLRETIGQAISDWFQENEEGDDRPFDIFDSREIDDIANRVVGVIDSETRKIFYWDKLMSMCGDWQDGSLQDVTLTQDDATKTCIVKVNPGIGQKNIKKYYGSTFDGILQQLIEQEGIS